MESILNGIPFTMHLIESALTCRYLELESNGQRSEIRLHYWISEQQNRTEIFPYNLADAHWHRVALTLSATQLVLYVDCSRCAK